MKSRRGKFGSFETCFSQLARVPTAQKPWRPPRNKRPRRRSSARRNVGSPGRHSWMSEVPRRDSWMAARRRPNKLSLRRSLPGTQGKNAECALHALHGAKEALVGKSPSTSSSDSSDS